MRTNNFSLILDEKVMRKMGREEYYKTLSWLRKLRREIAPKLPTEEEFEDMMVNLACYGRCAWEVGK